MPLYKPTFPTRYLSGLPAIFKHDPHALNAMLAKQALNPDTLRGAGNVVTLEQFEALIHAIMLAGGRDDIGFQLGRRIEFDDHAALALPIRRCGNVDAMLRLASRFSKLVTPIFSMRYRRAGRTGEFICQPAAAMSALALRVFEEMYAVTFFGDIGTILGGRLAPFDVYLSIPAPAHQPAYDELRPARYHFGTPGLPAVRFVIPSELLDLPLQPLESVKPGEMETLSRLQHGFERSERVAGWVALILRESDGCQPTLAELAALTNTSSRTLRRKLAQEGASLNQLGKTIRHERARALLRDSAHPVTWIAYHLGYSDAANFSNAFRVLEGASPRAFRASSSFRHA